MDQNHERFMREAIRLSREGMQHKAGGPFGAIVVKDGRIIGRGYNQVTLANDPTAHAEVVAIRDACRHLNHYQLDDCILYASCEPCPMCLGAIYWARPKQIFYACTRKDAASILFDDDFIYHELGLPPGDRRIAATQLLRTEALEVFREWEVMGDKTLY